jgi:hypothetical protein
LLLERRPHYENACDVSIHTDGIAVAEITRTIVQDIKKHTGE